MNVKPKSPKSKRRIKNKVFPIYRGRRLLLLSLLLAGIVVLLFRAAYIEIYQQDRFQKESDKRKIHQVSIPAYRGLILDRNGDALAISSPVKNIFCNPKKLLQQRTQLHQKAERLRLNLLAKGKKASRKQQDEFEIAKANFIEFSEKLKKLAALLKMSTDDLEKRLQKFRKKEYHYLSKNQTPEVAKDILALELPNIQAEQEYRRFYPMAESASHLIGFTNSNNKGVVGIERVKNQYLSGKMGKKRVMRDSLGRNIEDIELLEKMIPGRNVTLSIDRRLQYATYKALKHQVFRLDATSGAAIVLDTQTGEILSMASMPKFNPNNGLDRKAHNYRNRAVADMFEVGSIMKPITIAAAISTRVIDPNIEIDTSPGWLKFSKRYTVRDVKNYGLMSLSRLLAKSSNVGASRIALLMAPRDHWMFLNRLGFGQKTHAGFDNEAKGSIRDYTQWSKVDSASHGYGYGIAATLLQMVKAYTPLATGGQLRDLSITRLKKPKISQNLMLKPNADAVLNMMETVVAPKATGKLAAVAGYRIAGKTGTARKLINKKYRTDRFMTSFIGIAPVSQPRLIVAVMIDDPKLDKSGGKAAAPVFAKIMGAALRILDIAPDKLPNTPIQGSVKKTHSATQTESAL